jgi:hypothetical protein
MNDAWVDIPLGGRRCGGWWVHLEAAMGQNSGCVANLNCTGFSLNARLAKKTPDQLIILGACWVEGQSRPTCPYTKLWPRLKSA